METTATATSPFTTSPQADGTVLIMKAGSIVIRVSPEKLAETLAHVEGVYARGGLRDAACCAAHA